MARTPPPGTDRARGLQRISRITRLDRSPSASAVRELRCAQDGLAASVVTVRLPAPLPAPPE